MITKLMGQLEIDHDRGVIYFHNTEAKPGEAITVLRICRLPPIPEKIIQEGIDLTHMHGVNYAARMPHQQIKKD